MKAISPALPMTAPSRQPNGADASAADEAFSALIAAVIGAPVAPSTSSAPSPAPSASSRSTTRVDKADDARPSSATSRSTGADRGAADGKSDQTGSATPSDSTKSPDATQPGTQPATQPATADPTAKQLTPGSASSTSGSVPPLAASVTDQPKVPAGLEKAAAALAQALVAPNGGAAQAAAVKGLPADVAVQALPVMKPGTALTEGQLPAQLVAAATAPQTAASPAAVPGPPDAKSGDKSGARAVAVDDKKPTPSVPVEAPTVDNAQAVVAPISTLAQQPARPDASSDAKASPAGGSAVASTTASHADHAKLGEPKPAAPDQNSQGVAPPHFDAQLSAQAPMQTTQLGSASPIQQPQTTNPSGMVPQQIVQVLAPLRTAKDGDYTLSLQLHPADLGAVTVRVEMQQGVLSVHMSAEHAHGHEALSQSLADLRTQLQTSGVRTGDIVVAAKTSALPQHQEQQHHAGGRHQQEAPMYDDGGVDHRPGDRPSRQAQQQADDDALDVRI